MGIFWAVLTYVVWGLTPVFWKQFHGFTSIELLTQRVFWSFLFLVPLLLRPERLREINRLFTTERNKLPYIALAAFLIGFNWYICVLAIITNRMLQLSLGYFMTPLVGVCFSIVLLKERLNRLQGISVAIAFVATFIETFKTGQAPFLAILMSSTFAFYAYLKRKIHTSADLGLAMEVFLNLPLPLMFFGWCGVPDHSASLWGLLCLIGPITVIPMIWYTWAIRRVSFMTVAFLQYLSPFIIFFIAVTLYHEPFRWPNA